MNKKASIMDGIIWIIIAFITLFVLAGLYYFHMQVYDGLTSVGTIGNLNVTNITKDVFDPITDNMVQGLNIIAFIILAGGAFSILIHNFLVREHPAWFIIYFLMAILAIIVSAYISNEYMALLGNDVIGSTLSEFTMGNFIMQYLPYWSAVIGILGAVFLFIGSLRDRELGGGIY
jgi:hypothetical protein